MSQFDNVGPGGIPSTAKLSQVDPNQSVMAQLSTGQLPANVVATLGSGAGANTFGDVHHQSALRMMSLGHLVTNRALTAQPATPPANGVSSSGTNVMTQAVASVAAGVMTVAGISGLPTIAVGMQLLGPAGWPQNLTVVSLGTGTGGLGTYNVSAPGVTASTSINAPSATVVVSPGSGG
jgi:hypothetical protein